MTIDVTRQAQLWAGQGPEGLDRMNREEAARAFESYMAEQMVREMRRTLPEGALGGQAVQLFTGLLDQQIAERIADRGGLGIARQLAPELGLEDAPETLAPGALIGPELRLDAASRRHGRLPVEGRITSRFGARSDPFTGEERSHRGMDIAAPSGAPIQAVASGRVSVAGPRGSYGKVVVVQHDDGLVSLYAHCSSLQVRDGDRIRAGQSIATVGETGRATGPHLHFEVRKDGKAVDPAEVYGWR